ncbi:TPA: hypothetical protein MI728_004201 [Klebsiella aerogenes]|mgnify:FL=1|nr:hypothetical protein [Klebsiella aerogenes]HBQ7846094.1 hypothetical protein [Klebsiella aerogenes]HBV6388162.1 hypothetical protein [Klebsiella aerogenes]HBY7796332.1 hypothetical protein [Klebsiella aerogenes]HBY7801450.1 hypothetical protein [Klebsiella aerogenes]
MNIEDSKRHDADDSNIVKGLTFYRFTIFGNERLSSQYGKLNPAAMLDKQLTSLSWIKGDIQHNATARSLEDERIWAYIADRVNRQSLLDIVRRG